MTNWIRMCCLLIYPEIVARHRNSRIIVMDMLCIPCGSFFLCLFLVFVFCFCFFLLMTKNISPCTDHHCDVPTTNICMNFNTTFSGQSLPMVQMTTLRFSLRLSPNHQAVKIHDNYIKQTFTQHYITHVGVESITLLHSLDLNISFLSIPFHVTFYCKLDT